MWRSQWFRAGTFVNVAALLIIGAVLVAHPSQIVIPMTLAAAAFVVSFGLYVTAAIKHPRADRREPWTEQRVLAAALIVAGIVIASLGHFTVGLCMVLGALLGLERAWRRRLRG